MEPFARLAEDTIEVARDCGVRQGHQGQTVLALADEGLGGVDAALKEDAAGEGSGEGVLCSGA